MSVENNNFDKRAGWRRIFPASGAVSALVTIGLSVVMGVATVLLVTQVVREYGIVLFVVVPCTLGFAAPMLHGMGAPRSFLECLGVAVLAQVALFGGMVVFAIEGIVCVIMAAPLWVTLAVLGTCVAYPLNRMMWKGRIAGRGFEVAGFLLLVFAPLMAGAERAGRREVPMYEMTTSVEIAAPPEVVWERLIEFPEIERAEGWAFWAGIARPVRAELVGRGVGATRYCVFSTGKAQEPIKVWDEPRELAFDVLNTPAPMKEWSMWGGVNPPHLEGFLESKRARFVLERLPGGRTRLTGTSWYSMNMYPAGYWRWWSEVILKQVHQCVLTHVKGLAEGDERKAPAHAAASQ